jgi:hypothetical protein
LIDLTEDSPAGSLPTSQSTMPADCFPETPRVSRRPVTLNNSSELLSLTTFSSSGIPRGKKLREPKKTTDSNYQLIFDTPSKIPHNQRHQSRLLVHPSIESSGSRPVSSTVNPRINSQSETAGGKRTLPEDSRPSRDIRLVKEFEEKKLMLEKQFELKKLELERKYAFSEN